MEACGGEACREVVPHFALTVALVEQQDARTGLTGREIGAFEAGAVASLEIHDARGRRLLCSCAEARHYWREHQQGEKPKRGAAAGHEISLRMIVDWAPTKSGRTCAFQIRPNE